MIRRPFVWILTAYLAGMFLAWYHIYLWLVIILFLFCFLLIYLLMFHLKIPYINRQDKFLWSLPLLMLLGFYAMGGQLTRPALDQMFDDKTECELTGKITLIVEKPTGRALYVKDNTVMLHPSYQPGAELQRPDIGQNPNSNKFLCENVIIYCSDNQKYLVGNEITVSGEIRKFSEAANPGQFNEKLYYQIENIDYKVYAQEISITDSSYSFFQSFLNQIRQKLIRTFNAILADRQSGTLEAMLLGEKNLLDEEVKQLYQENGISHILAISGLNFMLIGMFLYRLLRKLKIPMIPSTVLTILFIYCYGVLTYFSVSANRAVVMMAVSLLSALFGKTYDMLSATSLSAFLILLKNPMQIFSIGFLLSFGAVLGIALFLPVISSLFPSKNFIVSGLYVSVSAQLVTMPIILCFYYQFPAYSLIVNLLILPFMSALLLTAILAGIAGILSAPLGIFFIGAANYILKFYEEVCRLGSGLPGNLITVGKPETLRILAFFSLLLLFLWAVKRYRKKWLIAVLPLTVLLLFLPHQNSGLEITMLDLGQGEGIFIETEGGTTYLIDGGSADVSKVGTYRLQPFLLSSGVDTIDYAIVTHSDEDHISGITELLMGSRIKIKNLVLPDTSLRDEAYHELEALAEGNRVRVSYIKAGDVLLDGKLKMTCLHPTYDFPAKSNNEYSTVLSLSYDEFDMLLTGDLQKGGEELITQILKGESDIPVVSDYDVLQVAHHGSKSSTFENFLDIVHPETALISCGKDNFYGHPHQELLGRLKAAGSAIRITYECGAIAIKTDGKRMEVEEYKKK